ncbi:2Fe-2S iron-sulfur cluster-binding protein [Streptomyces sp. SCSIO 30461]|uniref:2Fe-2S iron-sulfur cluster-binding protein n=1 Tax=Streptomyces sp. SCSIO 30461 TaxID=3118085 RepID=UPI0030D156E5
MSTEDNGSQRSEERQQAHEAHERQRRGRWQPIPQGEYDSDMTAFVQLPPDGALDAPLAAPGHGFVPPPMITPLTPAEGAAPSWPEPEAGDPQATAQWTFPDAVHPQSGGESVPSGESAHDAVHPQPGGESVPSGESAHEQATHGGATELTGQWTIPLAQGDLPDESGEYSASALSSHWGDRTPPATLPGGAPAPWATAESNTYGPVPGPAPVSGESAPYPVTLPGGAAAPWAAAEPDTGAETGAYPEAGTEAAQPEDSAEPFEQPEVERPEGERPEGERPEGERSEGEQPEADTGDTTDAVPTEAQAEARTQTQAEPQAEARVEDTPSASAASLSPHGDEHPTASYVLRVNGADRPVTDAWVGESLLYVLRERLGLAGAKDGCSQGECGACNVQVDGRLVASCLVPAATAAGSEVRTVEGLAADGEPSDVQRALAACGAVQCGFCIPGMAMTVHDLLEGNHSPTELETRQALCGNLCRCSGYRGVLDAVRQVVAEREAIAETAEPFDPGGDVVARIPHQAPPGAGSVQPLHPHDGGMA